MNYIKRRKLEKLLKEKKPREKFSIHNLLSKFFNSFFIFMLFRVIKKTINKLNNAHFGMLFVIFCSVIFAGILLADKWRAEYYRVPSNVNQVYVEMNSKYGSLAYVSIMNIVLFMLNCAWANRRPRKVQVYPERG